MSPLDWAQLVLCGLGSVGCVWALFARPELPKVILFMLIIPLSTVAATQGLSAFHDDYVMSQGLRDLLSLVLFLALAGSVIYAVKS